MPLSGESASRSTPEPGRALALSLACDAAAGMVAAVVLIANIVSFAALMFPGAMAQGAPSAIWAMLVGSGLSGLWIAWKTSLAPMAVSIDSPTGAVLVLLSAAASASVIDAGGSTGSAVQAALLMLSAAMVLTGALLLALGSARRGAMLRFVPHFVVAGFLGATGWLLISGGVRMTTGHGLGGWPGDWSMPGLMRLLCAGCVFLLLLAIRRWVKSALAIPLGLLALTVSGAVALRLLGLSDPVHGWYLPSLGSLTAWSPLAALNAAPMPLATALGFVPDLIAVAVVALVSLVTKTSSLEVTRKTCGDFDLELRTHGLGTLLVAPLGGFGGGMQLGSSRLLESAGGASRLSGVACAVVLLFVGLAHFDLPALIPLPIAAGLVLFLGYGFLVEALAKPLVQRDWLNLFLALAIMACCVRFGYMVGVLGGIVAACLLFALGCARIGVVRQHLSRAQFAGHVSRSAGALRRLGAHGDSIHLYWLTGYLFFGSSEGIFERVRCDLLAPRVHPVRHVVLDFGTVTGADASATLSLAKLRNFCRQQGVSLLLSSLAPLVHRMLQREGSFAARGHPFGFDDINQALAWCEERLLDSLCTDPAVDTAPGESDFTGWLQAQLGPAVAVADLIAFLDQRSVAAGAVLYRQGEPADAIDLVAIGSLSVELDGGDGRPLRVRRLTTHSVIGEMGFFRHERRSATVLAEGPVTLFTLTRDRFDRLCVEQPQAAIALQGFLLRLLSERMVLTDRLVAALTHGEQGAGQPKAH